MGAENFDLDRIGGGRTVDSLQSLLLRAGELALRHFERGVEVEEKPDRSPVTQPDKEVEALIRESLVREFPDAEFFGEETGVHGHNPALRFILDPIDGTNSFIHGVPLYGVLIGVELEGEPVVGVAHFPATRETVVAAVGFGARYNGNPCAVSTNADLERALLLTTDEGAAVSSRLGEGWAALRGDVAFSRTWGDAYGHMLVATGRADIMVDPELSPWDAAPLLTIMTEAGGRFTSVEGESTIHGGSGVSSNGLLHDEALERLRVHLRMDASD